MTGDDMTEGGPKGPSKSVADKLKEWEEYVAKTISYYPVLSAEAGPMEFYGMMIELVYPTYGEISLAEIIDLVNTEQLPDILVCERIRKRLLKSTPKGAEQPPEEGVEIIDL